VTKFVRNMRGLSMNLVFNDFGVAISKWRQSVKFSSRSVLSRAEIQRYCQLPGVITPKPLIG
jgi:hypothetical protein